MKSRIARLEGEARTAKRLHDSLGKHVKILEIALTKEREKVSSLTKGEKVDLQRNSRDVAREELKSMGKGHFSYITLLLMTDSYQKHTSRAFVSWTPISSKTILSTKDSGKMRRERSRKAISRNALLKSPTTSCPQHIHLQS